MSLCVINTEKGLYLFLIYFRITLDFITVCIIIVYVSKPLLTEVKMSQPNPSFKNNFAQADRDFAVTCYKAALDFCEKNELLSESDFKALIAANIESSGIANDFTAICVNIQSTVKSLPRKGNFTIQVYKNFARRLAEPCEYS